jgi:hypothetical protein
MKIFESVWNRTDLGATRGAFLFEGTGSDGLAMWIIGFKVIWTDQIEPYPFGLSDLIGSSDGDPTAVIESERTHRRG